ncbi:TATA-box-binding protein [Candidatus Aenigmatarchaeota archaeon]
MPEFDIKVENVVAFAVLGMNISLKKLVDNLDGTEYNPERFPGLVYRINEPKAATLIFSSGKTVCTGTRSVKLAKEAVNKVVDHIRKTGVNIPKGYNIRIENIVASTQIDAQNKLNLEKLAFELENSEYEPESFPGLVYRIRNPKAAFLLFGSGKIICTGTRKVKDIRTALEKFKVDLEKLGIPVTPIKKDAVPGGASAKKNAVSAG